MPTPLSHEIKALVDGSSFAHLATLMSDGSPQNVPVWWLASASAFWCAPAIDFHDPYREVQIRGRVVEHRSDGDCKYIDAISRKYTGKPFPFRQPEGRVALVIEIEKERFTKAAVRAHPAKGGPSPLADGRIQQV